MFVIMLVQSIKIEARLMFVAILKFLMCSSINCVTTVAGGEG